MNLRDLEYLIAVAEESHFHKAAARCYVSQPTLSGQIKKLEDELGVLLIERSNRRVKMTDVGNAVTNQARRVLAEVRNLKEIAATYDDPMAGEIHVGLIPTVAPYLLPYIIPSIKKHCPRLKLWLYEHQTHQLLEKLNNGEIDMLILALPIEQHDFEEVDLFEEPFWLALPAGDPLASKTVVTLNDISNRELMLLEEGHCLRDHALDVCYLAGAIEQHDFQATSLETLRHMVSEDMGITLIPELALPARKRKDDPIKYIPFRDPKPSRRIGMLYRKHSYRTEVFTKIAEIIQQQFKE